MRRLIPILLIVYGLLTAYIISGRYFGIPYNPIFTPLLTLLAFLIAVLHGSAYFGWRRTLLLLASILAGVGTAGVPGGSLPVIVLVLQSVGVPGTGIGVILGVDRFLDMCRTTLNVTGDLAAAVVVSRGEASPARVREA